MFLSKLYFYISSYKPQYHSIADTFLQIVFLIGPHLKSALSTLCLSIDSVISFPLPMVLTSNIKYFNPLWQNFPRYAAVPKDAYLHWALKHQ